MPHTPNGGHTGRVPERQGTAPASTAPQQHREIKSFPRPRHNWKTNGSSFGATPSRMHWATWLLDGAKRLNIQKFTTTFHRDKLCYWTGGANRRRGADSCNGAAVQRMDPWDHATRARRRSWAEAPDLHGTHAPPTRSGARQLFASRRGGDGRQAAQAGQPLVCEIAGGSPLLWEKNTSNEGVNRQGETTASSPCQSIHTRSAKQNPSATGPKKDTCGERFAMGPARLNDGHRHTTTHLFIRLALGTRDEALHVALVGLTDACISVSRRGEPCPLLPSPCPRPSTGPTAALAHPPVLAAACSQRVHRNSAACACPQAQRTWHPPPFIPLSPPRGPPLAASQPHRPRRGDIPTGASAPKTGASNSLLVTAEAQLGEVARHPPPRNSTRRSRGGASARPCAGSASALPGDGATARAHMGRGRVAAAVAAATAVDQRWQGPGPSRRAPQA